MTRAETRVLEDDREFDAPSYASAILNILEDFGGERERQADSQRAVLNILDDIATEKLRLEATQKAVLNILDDFDIERRRVEQSNGELRVLNQATRDFMAVAAHDLRSPLASIVGFATLLNESWETFSEEDRRRSVATIDRQSRNLSRLVDDLFTLSSIEGGALSTRPELIVLAGAIGWCLESGGGDAASVSVSCSPDLVVLVDPHHLGRILDNYLQNAFKYGEPPVRIEASQLGEVVEVRVLDHGPGVPPEFLPRLFDRFARANTPSAKAEKGAGLGLSIVRGLAEANGGQARYEPNVPIGSCFVVCVPAGDTRPNG